MSVCTSAIVAAKKRGREANDGNDRHSDRRQQKQIVRSAHQIHAARYHRRGVDEGGHRCRAFHRVGQPHVQRNLRRFARRAKQHE